jgi:DNA-binding PadR family transcriptional regulator
MTDEPAMNLGEWACLGALCHQPAHGFAVAARLSPEGDVGRVWHMKRPLTYRCLARLQERGHVAAIGQEPGVAGGNRTILSPTRSGRTSLRRWLTTPVEHLRDMRSELLLKLVLADLCAVDLDAMLVRQRRHVAEIARTLDTQKGNDVVAMWRAESANAARRFLEQLEHQ